MASEPIRIDLRNLTAQALEECRDKPCGYYAAPCVIGTLVPEGQRRALDEAEVDETDVKTLVVAGLLVLPADQLADAIAMQEAFDGSDALGIPRDFERVEEIAGKYISQVPA